ncbi:fibronectin type III domain protein, partial [Ancylostoma caninum]
LRILIIRDLVPKDTGTVVEVRLGDSVATSKLIVEDTLAEITKRLERKTTGKEGESVVLSVELDHEPKEVAWFKDERPISTTERLHISIEETVCMLTIDRADYHDSGQYTVVVDGSKCYTNLQILSKPLVKPIERGVVQVERDENIMINVAFECHEEPTITCLFNGSPLREDAKTHIEVHESVVRFTKKHVTKADSGEYTIKLSNDIGEGSETITVKVKDVPDKPSNISITDIESEAITITWTPPEDDGGQPITGYVIEKKEDGRRTFHRVAQVSGAKTSYTVEDLDMTTGYILRVAAVNKYGPGEPVETPV